MLPHTLPLTFSITISSLPHAHTDTDTHMHAAQCQKTVNMYSCDRNACMQTDVDKSGSKLAFQPAARFAPVMDQVHDALSEG